MHVIDGLLPWSRPYLPVEANFAEQMQRFQTAGITHVSLTVASGRESEIEALSNLSEISKLTHDAGIVLVKTAEEIIAARNEGRLSASLHFQSATPFSRDLQFVDAFFQAGIGRDVGAAIAS